MPANAMKLTDARFRALKPTDKVQKISDGGGLYIHVGNVQNFSHIEWLKVQKISDGGGLYIHVSPAPLVSFE